MVGEPRGESCASIARPAIHADLRRRHSGHGLSVQRCHSGCPDTSRLRGHQEGSHRSAALPFHLRVYRECGQLCIANLKSSQSGRVRQDPPPLLPWLRFFILPSVLAIAATYTVLRVLSRKDLKGEMESGSEVVRLSNQGRRSAWGIMVTGLILIAASLLGLNLGLPTCLAAIAVVVAATGANRRSLAKWSAAFPGACCLSWLDCL